MHAETPAFVVLFADAADAGVVQRSLTDNLGEGVAILVPPHRGIDFFAAPQYQAELDNWWATSMPLGGFPVYLLEHHIDLARWLLGIDGDVYVAARAQDVHRYDGMTGVHACAAADLADFVAQVLRDRRVSALTPAVSVDNEIQTRAGATFDLSDASAAHPVELHPLELLAAMVNPPAVRDNRFNDTGEPSPGERLPRSSTGVLSRIPSLTRSGFALRREGTPKDADLAAALCARGSTVIAVGSRKGGVGKTSHAAGIAISAGETLDAVGHRAAIVDANLANPDAWGHLNLPQGAATAHDVAVALMDGIDPPRPIHATTPGLACYPERRDAGEYSRLEIQRFAEHLRVRFTACVIDLSNRLPDVTGGPEAAVAAYWLDEADVLLLPTASSKQEFNGVLDYLDLPNLPPVVVAYIAPRSRRNRQHPLTKKYLEAITQRVTAVVALPDEAERVRYAVLEGLPVQDVSPSLRAAYRRLTQALVSAANAAG